MPRSNYHSTIPHPKRSRISATIFRIFYSTSFTITILLLLAALFATLIDALYESYRRSRLVDIFIIAGLYAVTALVAVFMYAARLYTTRSVLKDIPKVYMPVEKSDLPRKRVWRLIEDCKSRSAVISYQARPRVRRLEKESERARKRIEELLRPEHAKEYLVFEPQWGEIAHRGWSSPANPELPGLEYETVVAELMDLIEARAVSLAPVNELARQNNGGQLIVYEYVIESLRRPEECGMRQYITQLIYLEVLENTPLTTAFHSLYDRARFSPIPLSDEEFKDLMRIFAELLRSMKSPNVDKLDQPDEWESLSDDDSSAQSLRKTVDDNEDTGLIRTLTLATASTPSIADSMIHNNIGLPLSQIPSFDTGQSYDTADEETVSHWTAPTSRPPFLAPAQGRGHGHEHQNRQPSDASNTSTRRHDNTRSIMTSRPHIALSRESLRSHPSRRSTASSGHGSVIRLRMTDVDYDEARDLPYEIRRTDSETADVTQRPGT